MHFLLFFIFFLIAQVNGKGPLTCNTNLIEDCLSPIVIVLNTLFTQLATDDFCKIQLIDSCLGELPLDCNHFDEYKTGASTIEAAISICRSKKRSGLKWWKNCPSINHTARFPNCRPQIESWFANAGPNVISKICNRNVGQYRCHVQAPKICNGEDSISIESKESKIVVNGCQLDFSNWQPRAHWKCNILHMTRCRLTMVYSKVATGNILNFNFFKANQTQFNEGCSLVEQTLNCVFRQEKRKKYQLFVQQSISKYKAIDYFCKFDRSGFKKFANCFAKQMSMFDSCGKSEPSDCSSYISIHKCLIDSSKENCGSSSAIDAYLSKSFQPMLNQKGCILNPHNNTNAAENKIFHTKFLFCIISVLIYSI